MKTIYDIKNMILEYCRKVSYNKAEWGWLALDYVFRGEY